MKWFMFIGLAVLAVSQGCKDQGVNPSTPGGIWVDASSFSDTLIFNSAFNDPGDPRQYFELRRGTEMRNGQKVPKIGAGIYEYKLSGNSISVYNLISSCYCFSDYYYASGENLLIGDFYESKEPTRILTFVRLP
jgi:hypothetical protein